MIHHLIDAQDWAVARQARKVSPASLATEGFIHCCMDSQVAGVIDRYYSSTQNLWILDIDETLLGAATLRWEGPVDPTTGIRRQSTSDEQFPHVYGPIPIEAVIAARRWDASDLARLRTHTTYNHYRRTTAAEGRRSWSIDNPPDPLSGLSEMPASRLETLP